MNDLVIKNEHGEEIAIYKKEMVDAVKNTVAVGATNEELYMFFSVAQKYGLDPFLKEVWFVKNEKLGGKPIIMAGRDAYVKIAQRNPNYVKLQSNAVYENDEFVMTWEDGDLKGFRHSHGAKDRGKILGAWATLKYTDKSVNVYVPFNEYAKNGGIWAKNRSAMIKKVAEKEVCRLVEGITGVYIPEEMPRGFDLETSQKRQKRIVNKVCAEPDQPETVEKHDDVIEAEIIQPEAVEAVDEEELTYYLNEIDEKTELAGREEAIAATETITEEEQKSLGNELYFEELIQQFCERLYEKKKPVTKGRVTVCINKSTFCDDIHEDLKFKDDFKEYVRNNWRK